MSHQGTKHQGPEQEMNFIGWGLNVEAGPLDTYHLGEDIQLPSPSIGSSSNLTQTHRIHLLAKSAWEHTVRIPGDLKPFLKLDPRLSDHNGVILLSAPGAEQGKQQQMGQEAQRNAWVTPFKKGSAKTLQALVWTKPTQCWLRTHFHIPPWLLTRRNTLCRLNFKPIKKDCPK